METLYWWVVLILTVIAALSLPGLILEFIKQVKRDFFNKGKGSDFFKNDDNKEK